MQGSKSLAQIFRCVRIELKIQLLNCSTGQDEELYEMQHKLPKGIWLSFDFEDSHPVQILEIPSNFPISPGIDAIQ